MLFDDIVPFKVPFILEPKELVAKVQFVAIGVAVGATDELLEDQVPVPILLEAETWNMYDVPFVNPITTKEVLEVVVPNVVHDVPLLDEYCT